MAHFAKISSSNHEVLDVHVVNNEDINDLPFPESEPVGIEFLIPWTASDWYFKQTSYNNNFRKNYATIGGTYDADKDAFIPVKFFSSWVLDEATCQWKPPTEKPNDGKEYVWDEPTVSWVEVEAE